MKKMMMVLLCLLLVWGGCLLIPSPARAEDLGGIYAQAAQLFIREDKYYGKDDNWFSYERRGGQGAWCGDFVSLIAKMMGVPSKVIPRSASAAAWSKSTDSRFHAFMKEDAYGNHDYVAAGQFDLNFKPEKGDIVTMSYYSYDPEKKIYRRFAFSHVGIVTDATDTQFTYVSGNYSKTVKISGTYPLRDYTSLLNTKKDCVVGFFRPDWSAVPDGWKAPVPVSGVNIHRGAVNMKKGEVYTPEVTVSPADAFCDQLFWESSNPGVAKVDKYTGKITAVSEGTATITARAIADGMKYSSQAIRDSISVTVGFQFSGKIYPLHATMAAKADQTAVVSVPSLGEAAVRTLAKNAQVEVDALLVDENNNAWYRLTTNEYVEKSLLEALSSNASSRIQDTLLPYGFQSFGMPFDYYGYFQSNDAVQSVVIVSSNERNGTCHQAVWYPENPENCAPVYFADIAADVTLLDVSAYDVGSYELTITFINYAGQPLYVSSGYVQVKDQRCSHQPADGILIQPPTCSQTGISRIYCRLCSHILEDYEPIVVPMLEHTPGEWKIVTEPTALEHGLEELHCAVCDAIMESRIIPGEGFSVYGRKKDETTGRIYILMKGTASWTSARDYAAALGEGYQLASMDGDSDQEQQIIQSLVSGFGKACWLGGTSSGGSWEWLSGKPISTTDARWASGQPSGAYGSSSEKYLGIYGDSAQTSYAEIHKWNDFSLNSSTIKGFVIEYAPKAVSCPSHLTISVGETYRVNAKGAVSYEILEGAENISLQEEAGDLMLQARAAGPALIQFIGEDGSAARMGITVMPYTMYFEIYPESEDFDGIVEAGREYTFRLHLKGPQAQYISDPVWSVSDPSKAKITSSEQLCTVQALENGTVTLRASVDILMEDGYLNPIETWTAEVIIATVIPDASIITCQLPAGNAEEKLDYLREVFLDGWHFNFWDAEDREGCTQYSIRIGDHTLGLSNKPCDHTACSQYWGYLKGTRSTGYARILYYLLWDHEVARDSYMYIYNPKQDRFDFLEELLPGEMIYTGSHHMVVTGTSGDRIYVTDCNADGQCGIRWDAEISLDELKNIIRESGVGRVYSPYAKVFPIYEGLTEYTVLPGKTLKIYSHPFNDSKVLHTFEAEEIFDADLSHAYENTNASYGKGTWAICYGGSGERGWALISDSSVCVQNDQGDQLKEHIGVIMPEGILDLETFCSDLLEENYEKYFTGLISGMLCSAEVTLYRLNPVTNEREAAVAWWAEEYDASERTAIDFPDDVRFQAGNLYLLTEGAYICETKIRYVQDGEECLWFSSSSDSVFWLTQEETSFPTAILAESYELESDSSVNIPVTVRGAEHAILYAGIEMLEGADKANVTWRFADGELSLDVEYLADGKARFNLLVADSFDSVMQLTFTVHFVSCDHENIVCFHTIPCTEEGYWSLTCEDCGALLDEGTEAFEFHEWFVEECRPATHASDGFLSDVYCVNCWMYAAHERVIPAKQSLFLPDGLKLIEAEAFAGIPAVQVVIPEGTEMIESRALADCSGLMLLILPESLSSIAQDALGDGMAVICCSPENDNISQWAQSIDLPLYIME